MLPGPLSYSIILSTFNAYIEFPAFLHICVSALLDFKTIINIINNSKCYEIISFSNKYKVFIIICNFPFRHKKFYSPWLKWLKCLDDRKKWQQFKKVTSKSIMILCWAAFLNCMKNSSFLRVLNSSPVNRLNMFLPIHSCWSTVHRQ